MTKTISFQLEAQNDFNPYIFYREFKKLQERGFFKEIVRISKLEEDGNYKEMKEQDAARAEQFIMVETYKIR